MLGVSARGSPVSRVPVPPVRESGGRWAGNRCCPSGVKLSSGRWVLQGRLAPRSAPRCRDSPGRGCVHTPRGHQQPPSAPWEVLKGCQREEGKTPGLPGGERDPGRGQEVGSSGWPRTEGNGEGGGWKGSLDSRVEGWGHLIRIPCPENTRAAPRAPPRGRACVLMPDPALGLLLTGDTWHPRITQRQGHLQGHQSAPSNGKGVWSAW